MTIAPELIKGLYGFSEIVTWTIFGFFGNSHLTDYANIQLTNFMLIQMHFV